MTAVQWWVFVGAAVVPGALTFAVGSLWWGREPVGLYDPPVVFTPDEVAELAAAAAEDDLTDEELRDLAQWALECERLAAKFDRLARFDARAGRQGPPR